MEELEHVARRDLEGFIGGDAVEETLRERPRIGPVALDVREVGGEHDVLRPHVVAQLDGHPLHVLHAEVDVLPHVVARPLRERLPVEEPRRPVAVALVPVVRLLHPERHPAETGLGKEDLQIREPVEDAGEDCLGEAHRRGGAEERQGDPLHDGPAAEPRDHRRVDAGILERRLLGARALAIEADVHGERHLHLDGRRPEPIVLRYRIALPAGEHAERDSAESELRAVLELGDGIVQVGPGDDAEPDEPISRDGAVLFAEPVVVGADRRAVGVVVGHGAPQAWAHLHVGEEDLGFEAVLILLRDALLRRSNPGRVGDRHAEGLPRLIGPPGPQIEKRNRSRLLAFHEQCIAAVRQLDRPRRLLAQPRRHPPSPPLRQHFKMPITRDQRRQRSLNQRRSPYQGCRESTTCMASSRPNRDGAAGRGGSSCEAAPESSDLTVAMRQAAEKGPVARRRPKAAGEAYFLYVEPAAEGANEANGPLSAACRLEALFVDGEA